MRCWHIYWPTVATIQCSIEMTLMCFRTYHTISTIRLILCQPSTSFFFYYYCSLGCMHENDVLNFSVILPEPSVPQSACEKKYINYSMRCLLPKSQWNPALAICYLWNKWWWWLLLSPANSAQHSATGGGSVLPKQNTFNHFIGEGIARVRANSCCRFSRGSVLIFCVVPVIWTASMEMFKIT